MRAVVTIITFIFIISGCSKSEEQKINVLEKNMSEVIDYKLNSVVEAHTTEVNQWLANARENGIEGQYFMLQDKYEDKMYSYVYRKGYSNYEVSFIYDPNDTQSKGKIHVTGIGKNSNDSFIQIKHINDLSILFILSDEKLENKLK